MATKTILKDAKAPFLFLAAALPKAAAPKPQLIRKPLLHLSGLRHYLYQQPATNKVDGVGLGGALDSTFGPQSRVQARRSDDEEDDHIEELEDEDDYQDDSEDFSDDFSDEEDEEDILSSESKFDHDKKNCTGSP
ncbi:hypothetical protein M0R45_014896 [Rubus argutus]|uniref:Uncharacterized protein n=1 Tax=Rubus argutus TaxID=59490 RepID=A0AAW1XPP5_RUBAR